ncbi:hypothetical protein, partial [Cetobacterium sp.]|uniref:hypothetical protein n=1 Tax=Cetobacterium sp. TaxID=2071632 RepID=UPI003F676D81
MLINVGDMKYYFENFTEVVDEKAKSNKLAISTLDGRVAALEQQTPGGPGGTGAYLNLGGTPDRYPTAEEMADGDSPEPSSFLVVAREDGIYFYNPKNKILIPPKKGGGTIAVHGQFPQIFDDGHSIKHDGRVGLSGVYTAKTSDLGLDGNFLSYNTTKVLVVVTDEMEYQTALHPDGTASRIFAKGNNTAPWSFHSGGGGGGSIDPAVIQEINRRLEELEATDHFENFIDMKDVDVDVIRDVNGLLYLGEDGKVRGGSDNPLLGTGIMRVHPNSIGSPPLVSTNSIGAISAAATNVIVTTAPATRTITLPHVVPADTFKPSNNEVREGRTTYVANHSDVVHTIRVSASNMFYRDGSMDSTSMELPPKTVFTYSPALLDNGSGAIIKCWIFIGSQVLTGSELGDILLEIEDLKTKNDDQQADLDFIKREMESGKLVIEGLQNSNID